MGDILIVDDEKDIRELISEILIDEGYSTRLSSNSAECLNHMSQLAIKGQVLDWQSLKRSLKSTVGF